MIPSNKCDAIATHNTNTSLAGLRTKTTATLSLFLFSFLLLVIFFPFLLFLPFFLILFFFLQGLAIPQNKNETKQPETKQDKTDKTNKQTPYTQDWKQLISKTLSFSSFFFLFSFALLLVSNLT